MRDLGYAVIQLRGIGLVNLRFYHRGKVLFQTVDKNQWYSIDVETGLMYQNKPEWLSQVLDGESISGYERDFYEGDDYKYHPVGADDVTLNLIECLVTHRVSGVKILQGLQVYDVGWPSLKLQENYLGGWNLWQGGKSITIANFIDAVERAVTTTSNYHGDGSESDDHS